MNRAARPQKFLGDRAARGSSSLVAESGDHGVDNEDQEYKADAEEDVAGGAGDALPGFPLVLHAVLVQAAFGDQAAWTNTA